MAALDPEMEREIEDLRKRYQAKRQPILDAIDAKKKRQQNFWLNDNDNVFWKVPRKQSTVFFLRGYL